VVVADAFVGQSWQAIFVVVVVEIAVLVAGTAVAVEAVVGTDWNC